MSPACAEEYCIASSIKSAPAHRLYTSLSPPLLLILYYTIWRYVRFKGAI